MPLIFALLGRQLQFVFVCGPGELGSSRQPPPLPRGPCCGVQVE
jgi:hypothetical protein